MQTDPDRHAVVIEDDADVRNLVTAILREAGFTCTAALNGIDGINAVREHRPILTTLDISLPGMDGFEVARQIRRFSQTYVIMLSARDEEIDTLMGLDAGADDYLTKPFRPRELRARVEAMLRRVDGYGGRTASPADASAALGAGSAAPTTQASSALGADGGWIRHNGVSVHPEMWLCELDGRQVELTRSEFDLLLTLLEGKRRVISKDRLALELRGAQSDGYVSDADRRAVEVHVANLRRKLSDPVSSPRFIETVRGVGYRLAEIRSD